MDNKYFLMNCDDCKQPTIFYCDGSLVNNAKDVPLSEKLKNKDLATCMSCLNTHSYEHEKIEEEQLKGCADTAKKFVEGHLERLLGEYETIPEEQRASFSQQIKTLAYMYKNITGDWYHR